MVQKLEVLSVVFCSNSTQTPYIGLTPGSIMRLRNASHMNVKTFPSGSTELDLASEEAIPEGALPKFIDRFLSH